MSMKVKSKEIFNKIFSKSWEIEDVDVLYLLFSREVADFLKPFLMGLDYSDDRNRPGLRIAFSNDYGNELYVIPMEDLNEGALWL